MRRSEFHEIVDDLLDDIDGDGKGVTGVGSRRGGDRGVDADQLAVGVDERSAAVARVNGCIGLDKGFDWETGFGGG